MPEIGHDALPHFELDGALLGVIILISGVDSPDSVAAYGGIMSTAKELMIRFVEEMPEDVTFDELEKKFFKEVQYRRHVQKMIEAGLKDVEAGRTYSHEEVMKYFGFDS